MINAAVPVEAYDYAGVSAGDRLDMVEDKWRSRYNDGHTRILAANWHELFEDTPADNRNLLSWKNAFFEVLELTETHNFFSPGEDVLARQEGTYSASAVSIILSQGFNFSRGAWKAQELVKGKSWWSTKGITAFMSRTQAGWDLRYLINPDPATLTDQHLRENPYFDNFREDDLTDPDPAIASTKAGETKVRYDLLARGIPALSYAAAVMELPQPQSGATVNNWNLHTGGRPNGNSGPWPTEGHTDTDTQGAWLHSDFRNVALPYVFPMYEIMINQGLLYED